MRTIKQIRAFYGISQELMADYLRINRGQLAMSELKRRVIPTEKNIAALWLYKIMIEPPAPQTAEDAKLLAALHTQAGNARQLVKLRMLGCRAGMERARRKLVKMEQGQQRSLAIIARLETLKAAAKKDDLPLITVIENAARVLQEKTNEAAQLELQLKMHGLQAQIEFLEVRE